MRLSRPDSVVNRRKNQSFRNKFREKKKHKRLDAICERAYTRNHSGVERVDSGELNNGGNELELRRSNRARRAPVVLDSSPMPPKKRMKVDRIFANSFGKPRREDRSQWEIPCSSSRDLDGQTDGWNLRLRSRGKSGGFSGRARGDSSVRGKRKLFQDFDGFGDDMEPQCYDKKDLLVSEKSTVVKSKRPGRIKASNVLSNDNLDIDMGDGVEGGKQKNINEVLEVMNEVIETQLETKSKSEAEDGDVAVETQLETKSKSEAEDGDVAQFTEREETTILSDPELEGYQHIGNANAETRDDDPMEQEKLACDLVSDQQNVAEINCESADQANNNGRSDKLIEGETCKKSKHINNMSAIAYRKPRIKLGRRCGLCGGGIDGKPPKIFVLEGADSETEGYSGSSASEETNYDVWDGFGDQSGWLGRLLGPINDRFGIAGIWVHQQCAVWSPEVYFAGLGCLKNIRAALYRGKVLKCSRCRRPGATIGCRVDRCPRTYHLPCARAKNCIFDHRKFLIACTDHRHLFQPYGIQNTLRLKKIKTRKLKLELRKMANESSRKDIEAEEKWLENCGEDEEFLKRESKRLQRDLCRIAPTYIGGTNSEREKQFQGWESVAGLQDVIRCMKEVVILPLLYPEFFNNIGLTPPRGVLLHGHPGTGKTLVVRALVGSCARSDRRIAYFARKGADCLGKYVGDAERQLRLLFQVAEKSQPSIIFFDEIDGLAPCRTKQQDQTHNSVVSTLLALMDGLKSRGSVIVIGATNRPDAVDPALRRPGRFDREIYFPLPSVKDREEILSLHTQKWPKPITGSLLKWVAEQTVGFAGADLQSLCSQAATISLRRSFPLQKVLSAAETNRKCPAITTFAVEERDWLKALSCAPPPCSRRESGIALNDVVSSPLKSHLVPCLVQSLTRLLVFLYLDERVWLPLHLIKASTLVKNIIVSHLDRRKVQSENWWLQVDGLLQEASIMNEIEKSLLLANVLIGGSKLGGSNVTEENPDEYPNVICSKSLRMGARTGIPQTVCSVKSGYQVLICGNPRFGQRHLASCLLHSFVGNVDVWKVDLASISHEGHGDMVHGLTRILMKSTGADVCMLYMPTIDLWAVEAYNKASEDYQEPSSTDTQSSGEISCDGNFKVDMEHKTSLIADVKGIKSQTLVKEASYLWTSFIEQVESIRVNTSLIILATSEVPFSLLPYRIRNFFGSEVLNCSSSNSLVHKEPQFCVQLDGKFDHDKAISAFAATLTKDLAQHFIQLLHGGCHTHVSSLEVNAEDLVDDVDQVCHSKPCNISPVASVVLTNKTLKGKSNLLLAISTLGYQILCYPHFAELCWVTSKLKVGPCANTSGPWKGWPFNTCIIRPIDSADNVTSASNTSNIKSKDFGLVRGLVAVGLSAYRGEYTSLREVCSAVRKVLEILVVQIDDKLQAGKDRTQFIRVLSQVAYLEDMVSSWTHTLQSLEVDTHISGANASAGLLDSHICCKDGTSEGDVHKLDNSNVNVNGSEPLEKRPQEVGVGDAEQLCPTDADNECAEQSNPTAVDSKSATEGDQFAVTVEESPHQIALNDNCCHKSNLAPNEVKVSSEVEAAGVLSESGNVQPVNVLKESNSNVCANGPCGSGDKQITEMHSFAEIGNQPNDLLTDNCILSKDTGGNSGGSDLDVSHASNPDSLTCGSTSTCFYQCCSECFVTLNDLLLRIVHISWKHKGIDSTVDDVHDFVASLSANLHLSLSKLCESKGTHGMEGEEGGVHRKYCECREIHGVDMKKSDKLLMDCDCHAKSKNTSEKENYLPISEGLDSRFLFKGGVLAALDPGTDVSYHCKYEKLCLCFLIEWLVTSREPFD